MRPNQLRTRILTWAVEETRLTKLPPKANNLLEALLYPGALPHGDAAAMVGTRERRAHRIVSAFIEKGVVISERTRMPLRPTLPATLASQWMPGLFPERAT